LEGEGDDQFKFIMINSSLLECEFCVVRGLKVKEGGFRVKFDKVCE